MTDDAKFHTTTSIWTDNIEKILKELGESCLGYKWMNMFAAKKNELKYNTLMYLSIIIGPIAGILSVISSNNDTTYLPVIITLFSFINGVISAVIKFSDFGDKSAIYKNIATKYASLESNIRRQLSLTRNDRVNAGEYLEWISRSYDELFTSTPLIADDIYQQWVEFAKQNNLSIPKDLEVIVADSNTDKINQLITVNSIDVCKNNTENHKEIPEKINKRERTSVDGSTIDLGKFSDGKMRYEMSRLFRMK